MSPKAMQRFNTTPPEGLLVLVRAIASELELLLLQECCNNVHCWPTKHATRVHIAGQYCSHPGQQSSPPQVRMKNTSRVRSVSRVRSETPIMLCSAMEKGACGTADAAISAKGAQCCG
jgi:hypothetical protein